MISTNEQKRKEEEKSVLFNNNSNIVDERSYSIIKESINFGITVKRMEGS